MPRAISPELKKAVVEAYLKPDGRPGEIAAEFGVSISSVHRWMAEYHKERGLTWQRRAGGPRAAYGEREIAVLVAMVRENPQATLEELQPQLAERTGVPTPSTSTLLKYLHRQGFRRQRPRVVHHQEDSPTPRVAVRYQPHHRPDVGRNGYPTDLTDAEWELLSSIFAPTGQRGRPPQYERRLILDAIFYVVRAGCPWRLLPTNFPPWQNVYAHFRRWSDNGFFEKMHHQLRQMWRQRQGRDAQPSGVLMDSQSVKTTEKGGQEDTMLGRKSQEESDILWSIPAES